VEVQTDSGKRSAGKTALVVDDSAAMRKMLVAAFLSDGFTCVQAENGKEGIELAKQIHPDLISLDLSMPVMNGLEAASRLRKIFPNTPIILFSLYADTLSTRDASDAGVSLVLSKTVPLPALIDKARELMGN
jgi:two-component system chemotaxis response regulator CheY